MARIHVAILGAGRIAQHMADTLVKMAADSRYADLVEPYASPLLHCRVSLNSLKYT